MASENKQILEELKEIKSKITEIKEHMVDIDNIMTEEDYEDLLEYRKEKEEGKLTSHENLKKELDL